ncbi:hypothetical protein R1flu_025151 [Riccia fluitans]|uniref:Uncharacterized protein n=1 Tax=Riccia fluitans TaxID=41844 RepID=A0ABD1XWY1_9MARC
MAREILTRSGPPQEGTPTVATHDTSQLKRPLFNSATIRSQFRGMDTLGQHYLARRMQHKFTLVASVPGVYCVDLIPPFPCRRLVKDGIFTAVSFDSLYR